ncbi:HET-domain-containing protein [Trametes meyenii]|nr:HET-domain-containing protein [Trametes meyenii]
MPCFPPLRPLVHGFFRAVFKRRPSKTSRPTLRGQLSEHPPQPAVSAQAERHTASPSNTEGGEKHQVPGTPSGSLVCDFCWETGLFAQDTFQRAWALRGNARTGFSYMTTWQQLQASSDLGCNWCAVLYSTRTASMQLETVRVAVRFRVSNGSNGETPKGVQIMVLMINDRPHSSYYIYTQPDDPAAPYIVARDRVLEVNSATAQAMVLESVADCRRKHGRCPTPHDGPLPTRVIDCSDPNHPRLHLSNGAEAPYVALSYVWGEAQPHRTTTGNVRTYLRGIDAALLPQTIKDAIECTYSFGMRYLWVDALCILQDSKDDKAREIAQMRAIYQNAHFTIIAASAHTVSEGFLHTRAPSSRHDVVLPFLCPNGNVGTMTLSPVWRQYDGLSEPINQRAWCLEERFLSPRALVYASHTLQFQCRTATVNIGNAVCGPTVAQHLPDLLFRPDAELPITISPSDKDALRWAWLKIVGNYTQRAVTKPGDKLIAFAAIAELFHRVWKTDYLAGLWRDTLILDLLWFKNLETRFERPARYRAPSWSWAAVDGRVLASPIDDRLNPESKNTQSCMILGCEAVPATPLFPFGKVSSGTLRLRGVMRKSTWNSGSPTPELYLPGIPFPVIPESEETPPDQEATHIGCAYPDSVEDVQEVWAIPVIWNSAMQYATGLIVASAGEEGTYRRVGHFHSPEDHPGGLAWMEGLEEREIVIV